MRWVLKEAINYTLLKNLFHGFCLFFVFSRVLQKNHTAFFFTILSHIVRSEFQTIKASEL